MTINPTTGDFSGDAWSENLGWIRFASTAPVANKVNTAWRGTVLCGVLGWCPLVRTQSPPTLPAPDTLPAPRLQPAAGMETPLPQGRGLSLGQETAVPRDSMMR